MGYDSFHSGVKMVSVFVFPTYSSPIRNGWLYRTGMELKFPKVSEENHVTEYPNVWKFILGTFLLQYIRFSPGSKMFSWTVRMEFNEFSDFREIFSVNYLTVRSCFEISRIFDGKVRTLRSSFYIPSSPIGTDQFVVSHTV